MANIDVEETLKKLTLDEKVELLSGVDFWYTKSLPHHGIPSLRLSDGPNGVRGTRFFNGIKAACFPCGTALGATFNTALLEEAGKVMGEEAKAKGAHVLLGPTINMQRGPLGGRGFESIGEDPFLAGLGAAALVRGIQSTGIQATIKHFVCNDHEHKRNNVHVEVTDRALREIYALPFQLVVRDANPGAFMTAYNGLRGTYCSDDKKLLQGMLRDEWGWKGLVMSDWYGTYSTTEAIKAGLDLEMPGPARWRGEALKWAVRTDNVLPHVLDARVREVLELVRKCAASGVPENAPEGTADTPETAALLRKIGNESIVLLKNENSVLPLRKEKKVLVIGPNAKVANYHGGGSASLASYYAVTPFDSISAKLANPPDFAIGQYSHKMLPLLGNITKSEKGAQGVTWKVYNEPSEVEGRECVDEVELLKTEILLLDYAHPKVPSTTWYATLTADLTVEAEEEGLWEFGIVVAGTAKLYINDDLLIDNSKDQVAGDGFFGTSTREEKGTFKINKGETYRIKVLFGSGPTSPLGNAFAAGALRVGACKIIDPAAEIQRAAALAREADQVVICAGLNNDWESEGYDRKAMKLPPGNDALIAAVGEANPNTVVVMQSGTPCEMPWADNVAAIVQAWYGGNETGNTIADVLFGDVCPSGKLSLSFPKRVQDNPAFLNFRTEASKVVYGEGVFIGYRYYEFAERDVLFPFGHGLSYTSFSFSDLKVTERDGRVTAVVTVKNTGSVRGAEVVQMYVAPPQSEKVTRPVKELKGFAKVELDAGESREVKVEAETKYAVSYFDEVLGKWCGEKGEYEVIVSNSSVARDGQALRGSFEIAETFYWSGI